MSEDAQPDRLAATDFAAMPGAPASGRAGVLLASAPVLVAKALSSLFLGVAAVVTARALGPGGRGILVLVMTLASFTTLVGTLGVNLAARIRMVSTARPVTLDRYLGASLLLSTVQFPFAMGVGLLLLPFTDVRVDVGMALLVGGLGASTVADVFLLDALFAFGRTSAAAAVDAAGSGLQLLFTLGVAWLGMKGVNLFVGALVAGAVLQAVISVIALRHIGQPLRPRFSSETTMALVREGYQGIGFTLGQALTFRVDRYVAGIFLSPAAVGIYSVAATGSEMLRLIPYAVSQVLFHRAAAEAATDAELARVRRLVIGGLVSLAALFALLAPQIVRIAFGSSFVDAVNPLRILLLAEVGMSVFLLHASIAVPRGRLAGIAAATMLGLGAVVVLDILLMPHSGIAGAAWASVAAYWVMGLRAAMLSRSVHAPSGR